MYDQRISPRQLTPWLVAAIVPTAVQLTAGSSWLALLPATAACLLCIYLRWLLGATPMGKVLVLLQWGLLILVLSAVSGESVDSWPRGGHKAVAVILLALAAWSAIKGISAAAGVGCIIFWFVVALYLLLMGAGLKQVQFQWLKPVKGTLSPVGCILLLTPAAAAIHLNKEKSGTGKLPLIGFLTVAAAVITAAVLSPTVTSGKENAFYEMIRSLKGFGQARRFEDLLSAGVTAGWFLTMSLYLTMCGAFAEQWKSGTGKWGILLSAIMAAIFVLFNVSINSLVLLILTAVFWVAIPLATQGIAAIKKS